GFDDGELRVAVDEDVVGGVRAPAPPAAAFKAAGRDLVLAPDAAAVHDAPARSRKGGVDVFGSGFGFVHRPGEELNGRTEIRSSSPALRRSEGPRVTSAFVRPDAVTNSNSSASAE